MPERVYAWPALTTQRRLVLRGRRRWVFVFWQMDPQTNAPCCCTRYNPRWEVDPVKASSPRSGSARTVRVLPGARGRGTGLRVCSRSLAHRVAPVFCELSAFNRQPSAFSRREPGGGGECGVSFGQRRAPSVGGPPMGRRYPVRGLVNGEGRIANGKGKKAKAWASMGCRGRPFALSALSAVK